jgi:hypothetical protein
MSVSGLRPFPIIPTVASCIGAQAIGALWYSPFLFGSKWMDAMKKKKPNFNPQAEDPAIAIAGAAFMWITSSVCFTTMVGFWNPPKSGKVEKHHVLLDLLCLAHTAWLGFALPQHVFATIFAEEDKAITFLGAGYSLVAYTWMAVAHYWF